jgi:hypothetical protein
MFRVTYAMTASTYGARFQSFCRRHLELEPLKHIAADNPLNVGQLRMSPDTIESTLNANGLNFLEIRIAELLLKGGILTKEDSIVSLVSRTENSADPSMHLALNFGFAVIGQVAVEAEGLKLERPAYVSTLRYLRVQDHLRRMGLARRALRQLISDRKICLTELDLIPQEQLPTDFPEMPSPEDYSQLKRLYEQCVAEMMMESATAGR